MHTKTQKQTKPKILNKLLQLQQYQQEEQKLQMQRKASIRRIQAFNRFIHIDQQDQYLLNKVNSKCIEKEEIQLLEMERDANKEGNQDDIEGFNWGIDRDEILVGNQDIGGEVCFGQDRRQVRMENFVVAANLANQGPLKREQNYIANKFYPRQDQIQHNILYLTPKKQKSESEWKDQLITNPFTPQQHKKQLINNQIPLEFTPIKQKTAIKLKQSNNNESPYLTHTTSQKSSLSTSQSSSQHRNFIFNFNMQDYCKQCDLFTNKEMLGRHLCYAKLNNKTNIENALYRVSVMINSNNLVQLCSFPELIRKADKYMQLKFVFDFLVEREGRLNVNGNGIKENQSSYLERVAIKRLTNICSKKIQNLKNP